MIWYIQKKTLIIHLLSTSARILNNLSMNPSYTEFTSVGRFVLLGHLL